jgi:ribosomal protein S18 acetylase RimI-like enzyme
MIKIRSIKKTDYNAVNEIGTKNYPENYFEGNESFESKMIGYPEGCFVADLDGIVGYVISFPYKIGKPYPIDKFYEFIFDADCYYIHDLCVMPEFRKKGIATKLAEKVLEFKWPVVCLVAVMGSEKFWEKFGFRGFAAINYYGLEAEYMLKIN